MVRSRKRLRHPAVRSGLRLLLHLRIIVIFNYLNVIEVTTSRACCFLRFHLDICFHLNSKWNSLLRFDVLSLRATHFLSDAGLHSSYFMFSEFRGLNGSCTRLTFVHLSLYLRYWRSNGCR